MRYRSCHLNETRRDKKKVKVKHRERERETISIMFFFSLLGGRKTKSIRRSKKMFASKSSALQMGARKDWTT